MLFYFRLRTFNCCPQSLNRHPTPHLTYITLPLKMSSFSTFKFFYLSAVCLSICLSVYITVFPLPVRLSACPSVCVSFVFLLFVHSPISISACNYICLFVCLSFVHLLIYLCPFIISPFRSNLNLVAIPDKPKRGIFFFFSKTKLLNHLNTPEL